MNMPFGKYKGHDLEDIIEGHTAYFIWLTSIELTGKLKEEVERLSIDYKKELDECREELEEWEALRESGASEVDIDYYD